MKVKTWRDPYDSGFSPTKPTEIELNTGLTVLVGCNGAGKSTLLLNIEEHCKQNKIPCIKYDNLHDGGSTALSSLFYEGNYNEGVYLFTSSEGESIKANIGRKSRTYKEFIQNGYVDDKHRRFMLTLAGLDKDTVDVIENKDRVFLFDAVDSGLSVDSIVEIRAMFDQMVADSQELDKNIFIIIAANEYELARNASCFDVNNGRYITFDDYEDYRKFIIKSRALKEKRIEKQVIWRQKQKEKELAKYNALKVKQDERLKKLGTQYDSSTWAYRHRRDEIERELSSFLRSARFLSEEDVTSYKSA